MMNATPACTLVFHALSCENGLSLHVTSDGLLATPPEAKSTGIAFECENPKEPQLHTYRDTAAPASAIELIDKVVREYAEMGEFMGFAAQCESVDEAHPWVMII